MAIRLFPARIAMGLPVFTDGGVVGRCSPNVIRLSAHSLGVIHTRAFNPRHVLQTAFQFVFLCSYVYKLSSLISNHSSPLLSCLKKTKKYYQNLWVCMHKYPNFVSINIVELIVTLLYRISSCFVARYH